MVPAPLIMVIVSIITGQNYVMWFLLIFLVLILLFYKLTVTVTRQVLTVRFGIGLVKKSFELSEIEEISKIKYPVIYGYGIRRTPKGWLYNVSGKQAIELIMKNGKIFWIGTDDPDNLERAIRNWMS
jgi:hypothetical protein